MPLGASLLFRDHFPQGATNHIPPAEILTEAHQVMTVLSAHPRQRFIPL